MVAIDGGMDVREREKIAKEIEKTSESIRKKHRALKTGKIEEDIAAKRHFGPIIEPLQKIVHNSSVRAIKDEPGDDVEIETSFIHKREEEEDDEGDASKRKRKRAKCSLDRSSTPPKSKRSNDAPDVSPITSTPRTIIETVQSTMPELLTSQNVFETTDDSLATTVRHQIETMEGREALLNHLGPLSKKYIVDVLRGDNDDIDDVYGVYLDKNGMMLGSKRFDVDSDDNVFIDGVRYIGTPGLYELIFKRMPNEIKYTEDDLQKYKSILLATNAYRRDYGENNPIKGNKGHKYKDIIKPLLSLKPKIKGQGLPRAMTLNDNVIDYVHWDDPNELVDRLRLLEASRRAGNNAHDNEMLSIIEKLREAGIIIN